MRKVLFEPWSLGDAIIAASVFGVRDDFYIMTQPRWHELLKEAFPKIPHDRFLSVSLPYAQLKKSNTQGLKQGLQFGTEALNGVSNELKVNEVLSIRGDFRDYISAKKIFPAVKLKMTGWFSFIARRIGLFDIPFRLGLLPVRNRYRAWCSLVGIEYSQLQKAYEFKNAEVRKNLKGAKRIGIHLGAQWRSKQFPNVWELKSELEKLGFEVALVAGTGDFLPEGIRSENVKWLMGKDLVQFMKECSFFITNDSGPMHLASALGTQVIALARTSNLFEWLPPNVTPLASEKMPRGYRAVSDYQSDKVLEGWPSVSEIVGCVEKSWGRLHD